MHKSARHLLFSLQFKTNVLGVIHTFNAYLPLIKAGSTKKCFVITSALGGPGYNRAVGYKHICGYSISKAAVNMVAVKHANTFKEEGILFQAVSPGLVKTMQGCEWLFLAACFVVVFMASSGY